MLKSQAGVLPDATCVNGKSAYKNMFGFTNYLGVAYDGQCDFFGGTPPLPEGLGWFIVLGIGTIFACLTSGMVWFSNRSIPDDQKTGNNSETFSAAGRTIPAGLTAADVVSKWTWAATLLQSSNVAYKFGVSGPFWYAAGATVQIILFAILAIEIKRKCPAIHTMLEVRSGFSIHIRFCCLVRIPDRVFGIFSAGGSMPLGHQRALVSFSTSEHFAMMMMRLFMTIAINLGSICNAIATLQDFSVLRPFVFAHRDGNVDPRRRRYYQRPDRDEH